MTWLLKFVPSWVPLAVIGLLVAALGVQTLRLSWAENELVSDKLAQADAVNKAKAKAEALSNELIIAQAAAMAVTERTVVQYVDRIRKATDDVERNRLGSLGVRDTLGSSANPAK